MEEFLVKLITFKDAEHNIVITVKVDRPISSKLKQSNYSKIVSDEIAYVLESNPSVKIIEIDEFDEYDEDDEDNEDNEDNEDDEYDSPSSN